MNVKDPQGILITIKKDNLEIANCLYETEKSFHRALKLVKDIIFNYNKYLAGASMTTFALAIRMFQQENKDGELKDIKPLILDNSLKAMQLVYPDFRIYTLDCAIDKRYGRIAIDTDDMEENLNSSLMQVSIDIEEKIIKFKGVYSLVDKIYWEKIFNHKSLSTLSMCEYDFDNLSFNEIEDAYNFVKNNFDGWLLKGFAYEEKVILPI